MLYKFKSRATADLILLEPHGRRLLQAMGKEPAAQGIVTVAQIPAAMAALEAAVAAEDRRQAEAAQADESMKPMRWSPASLRRTRSRYASGPRLFSTCCVAVRPTGRTWSGVCSAAAPQR